MKKSGWMLVPAAFFLLLNFSISPVKHLFFRSVFQFILLATIFLFLRHFDLNRIVRLSIGGIAPIIFIYGIIQRYLLFPIYLQNLVKGDDFYSQALRIRLETGRIFSIFTLPTLYAIICAALILFIIHFMIHSTKKNRLYWIGLLLLGIFNLALTQSFGGTLCLALGLIVYFLSTGILKLKYIAPVIMTLSLIFFILVALRFSEAQKLEPVKLRLSHWSQASRMIGDAPVWGIGLGNYEARVSEYTEANEAHSIYAHNFFLQLTAETGVFFPLMLLLALFCWRKKIIRQFQPDKALYFSVLCALLLYSFMDIGFYFFPAALLFVLSLSQVYRRHQGSYKLALSLMVPLALIAGLFSMSDSYQREGDLLASQQKADAALNAYKKSFRLNPYNHKALTGFAQIQLRAGNLQEAKSHLQRAREAFPQSPLINYLLSKINYNSRHYMLSYYQASVAYRGSETNQEYKRWYEFITTNLQAELSKSRR
jgi:tetratricopeptide (TPR) repeat protein